MVLPIGRAIGSRKRGRMIARQSVETSIVLAIGRATGSTQTGDVFIFFAPAAQETDSTININEVNPYPDYFYSGQLRSLMPPRRRKRIKNDIMHA